MAVFVINIMIFNNESESNFLLKLVFLNTTIHKDIVFATAILLLFLPPIINNTNANIFLTRSGSWLFT
jgi:hypothetical protein